MSKIVIPSGAVDQSITIPACNPEIVMSVTDSNRFSDGFHTIGELYQHRCLLFIALCNQLKVQDVMGWKAWKDHQGNLIEGWFLAGLNLPSGEISYHLPAELWTLLKFPQWNAAPRFDGHSSLDVVDRLTAWLNAECEAKTKTADHQFSKTVEAMQFPGFTESPNHVGKELARFLEDVVISNHQGKLGIHTRTGVVEAAPGDWIIRDQNQFSCCKPDEFAALYGPVA